jgi:hypothetical protein
VLNTTTEAVLSAEEEVQGATDKKASLKQYALEKQRSWLTSLLEAERGEFLGRGDTRLWTPSMTIIVMGIGHGRLTSLD